MKFTIDTSDIESLKDAIGQGITTPSLLAEWIDGAALVNGCLVPNPSQWSAADESGCEITEEYDSGEEAAQGYVDSGTWDKQDSTTWIHVAVWQTAIDEDGDEVHVNEESHTITIEPAEPECQDSKKHDWQAPYEIVGGCRENPGVWGNGGGVIINEVCVVCGCGRRTDTWAQDPSNGVQGLTSVAYTEGQYADEVAAME